MQRSNVAEEVHVGPSDQSGGRPAAAPGSSEVGDLWRILWCRRFLILAIVLLSGLGGLAYVLITPSEYTATAQILIDPRDRQIVAKAVEPDTLASDGGILQVESQSRVIESDAVLLRAIRALGLASDAHYGAQTDGLLARLVNLMTGASEGSGPDANEGRALRVLRKHLVVKRADKVFVVDVVVTAHSGGAAASIADAIAEAYLADQVQSRTESSTRASDALTAHLAELRESYMSAANQVERYKAAHDLVGTDKQLVSDQQLTDNGAQLDSARAKVAELRARADQLDAARRGGGEDGAMAEAIQSSVVTQLRASQAELARRRSDLLTRVGERHPDLIALDAEIAEAHRLITAELNRLVRSAHADLDRARTNERMLSGSLDNLKLKTTSSDEASVTLQDLVQDLNARRAIYQAFLARASETKAQSGIDNTNARIISRAIPPVQPSWPLRALLLIGAVGGGFGLGVALAFIAEYLAPTVLSPGQLEVAADAPVVGIVSSRSRGGAARRDVRRRGVLRYDLRQDVALGLALNRLCGPLRGLKNKPTARTVLVASARGLARTRGDIAARLALCAAEGKLAVLLVEADLTYAGRTTSPGFLNVLNGEVSFRSASIRDDETGLSRLRLGTLGGGRRDRLADDRVETFIRAAGRSFDLIIFNGGPFADSLGTAPLAGAVDEVLFVALRGETRQREVAETADAILSSTGRPVSAALLVDHLDAA